MLVSELLTSHSHFLGHFLALQKPIPFLHSTSHELFSSGRLGGWENMDVDSGGQGLFAGVIFKGV